MASRKRHVLTSVVVALCALFLPATGSVLIAGSATEDATLLRVFLKDGSSLVSYGEPARVGDRVVFSMPTGSSPNSPLHLVTIPASRVDWARTDRYANSARAARYIETQAELDYSTLSNRVTETLNQVTKATEPSTRLALVEAARKTLSDWPATHYNYRQGEVQQMLALLDEAIADLRAASGNDKFSLSLLAFSEPPVATEPLLPPLTAKEAIEQVLTASRVVDTAADRESLLSTVLVELDKSASGLPADWVVATRTSARSALFEEQRIDRAYQALTKRIMTIADNQARAADVRGLERLPARISVSDRELGAKRPETVTSLVAAVKAQLDAARRLQLARDRWALREPIYRAYAVDINDALERFRTLTPLLEGIKSLASSSPSTLASIERGVGLILVQANAITPPQELRSAHALLISAVELALNAASIRREAVLADNIARAWDASSAAAGALMLVERARTDIETMLRPPQLR